MMEYPLLPKSNKGLKAGQFWSIQLTDGRFACGRVIDVVPPDTSDPYVHYLGSRSFLAGLMDWTGEIPPTVDSIAGGMLLDQGMAHVGSITAEGSGILGERPLELDNIAPLFWVTPVDLTTPTRYLYQGFRRVREARPDECEPYFGLSAWSKNYIRARADLRFVQGQLPNADYHTYAPFGE